MKPGDPLRMKTLWIIPAILLSSLTAHACPVINGTFESKEGSMTRTLQLYTSHEEGHLKYRLGAESEWLPADGRARRVETENMAGTVRVTCDGGTVTIASRPEGASPITLRVQMLDLKRVHVRGADAAEGVYTKVRE